jgi:two-component system cell cycle response regulator
MSVTDALTGAHNRRFLMKYLPRELERSRKTGAPLAVISCDIDHFKRVNDDFGHAAGDEVLKAFATRVGACIRQGTDWIARSGGEEFVVVLPGSNLGAACHVAERVRSVLAAEPMSSSAGSLTVTVSMGITVVEGNEDKTVVSAAELLRAADRGLYASKRLGRNRATVTSAESDPVLPDAQAGVILGAI